jgi:tetratricopeptide (TPR) repeat protein
MFKDSKLNPNFLSSIKTNPESGNTNRLLKRFKSDLHIPIGINTNQNLMMKTLPESLSLSKSVKRSKVQGKGKLCLTNYDRSKNHVNLFFKTKKVAKNLNEYTPSETLRQKVRDKDVNEVRSIDIMADPIDIEKKIKNKHIEKKYSSRSVNKKTLNKSIREREKSIDKMSERSSSILTKLQHSSRSLSKTKTRFDRALQLKKQKFYRKSLILFKKVPKNDPSYADSLFHQAYLLDKEGKYEEAVDLYKEFISLQPENAFGHFNLGICLKHMKQYDESLKCFDRVSVLGDFNKFNFFYCFCYCVLEVILRRLN